MAEPLDKLNLDEYFIDDFVRITKKDLLQFIAERERLAELRGALAEVDKLGEFILFQQNLNTWKSFDYADWFTNRKKELETLNQPKGDKDGK